jgi:hypothetical protein
LFVTKLCDLFENSSSHIPNWCLYSSHDIPSSNDALR